jgi:low temperature requirement protein LtrA
MDQKERNIWWGPPRKFSEKLQDRKISWLELFYDLVYVAAISQLTEYLAEHPNWNGLGYFFFIFSLIFWSWINGSNYHDIHGSAGIRTRYFTLLQMFVVAAVTITLPDLFEGNHQTFAIAFACVQTIITYLWWSVGYYDPEHRRLNTYYTICYCTSLVFIIGSVFTNLQTANYLWGAALFFNYLAPFIAGPGTVREFRNRGLNYVTSTSMIERFGLFTIIVLGETILGIVHGISNLNHTTTEVWVLFMLAVLIAFLLWWIYFDMTGDSEAKPGYSNFLAINLFNIPLLASFAATGSSIRVILHETETGEHSAARLIFALSVSIILGGIFLITKLMKQEKEEEKVMKQLAGIVLATSAVNLSLMIFCESMNAFTFLGIEALILLVPVYIGTRIWVRHKIFSEVGE